MSKGISEDDLQKQCIKFTRLQYPDKLFFHCPNGGKRNAREAAKFKAMGVLSGVSDILFIEPNQIYQGLAIELKVGDNKPTDNQKDFLSKVDQRGWFTSVCYDLDHYMNTLKFYFSIPKEGEVMEININPN